MNEIVFVVEESPEGGYIAQALGVSIVTEADTMDALKSSVIDAVECHFSDRKDPPKLIRLHFVKDEVISIAA